MAPKKWQKGGSEETSSAASGSRWSPPHGALASGLTTKIHALVDANGLPVQLKLTAGQAMTGEARPTCSPVSAKAKSSSPTAATTATRCGRASARQGAWGNIKPMPHRVHVPPPSAATSTAFEISSNASSGNSTIFGWRSEFDEGEVVGVVFFVACRDGSEMFEFVEEAFDEISKSGRGSG